MIDLTQVSDEGSCAGHDCGLRQWNCFGPGQTINNHEEIFHALIVIKEIHQINIETASRELPYGEWH